MIVIAISKVIENVARLTRRPAPRRPQAVPPNVAAPGKYFFLNFERRTSNVEPGSYINGQVCEGR